MHSSLDKNVRMENARAEVNRTLNWWSTGTSSESSLNPVPMDKVQAFINQPPLIDDLTSVTSLWTVPPAVGQPPPTPAPPAGPGPTPLRVATPLARQEAAQKSTRLDARNTDSPGTITDQTHPEQPLNMSEEASAKRSSDRAPLPPRAEPLHTRLPDADYKYIFPAHTIDSSGRVPLWFFNFRAERHCLGGSFTVFVFLGDFGADHSGWNDEENLLMPLFQFINHNPGAFESPETTDDEEASTDYDPSQTPKKRATLRLKPPSQRTTSDTCGNCAEQEARGAHLANTAPLTQNLIRYIHYDGAVPERDPDQPLRDDDQLPPVSLASLEREDVVPFLLRNLHWRIVRVSTTCLSLYTSPCSALIPELHARRLISFIPLTLSLFLLRQQADGTQVPRGELPSFRAFVTRRYMTLPKRQTDWPVYEEAELIWEVTDGRMGGLEEGELP